MAAASGLSPVARRSATRRARRAMGPGICSGPSWTRDPGHRLGIGESTDGGAGLLRALGARVTENLAGISTVRPRSAPRGNHAPDRLRRHQPAPRRPRHRRRCRTAKAARSPTSALGPLRGRARGGGPANVTQDTGRGCRRGGIGLDSCPSPDRFAALRLKPGIDLVMAEANFGDKLATADLVIAGESQSTSRTGARQDPALGVARRARAAGEQVVRRRQRQPRRHQGVAAVGASRAGWSVPESVEGAMASAAPVALGGANRQAL